MQQKFRQLITSHQDRLFSVAYGLLGQSGEAEEVVQDSFIKLWENLSELESKRILPWLIRVTRNACLDILRRRKFQTSLAVANGRDELTEVTTPVTTAENDRLRDSLRSAIEELKEPYRSLIILREIEGLDYDAIGEALDLNPSQVKVYLYRARRQLRHELQEFAQ